MLFVGRESRGGGPGFAGEAPLSRIDQSGCWRKNLRNFWKIYNSAKASGRVARITTDSTRRKAEMIVYCCRLRYLHINEGADVILENCTVQLAAISRLLRKYRPVEGSGKQLMKGYSGSPKPAWTTSPRKPHVWTLTAKASRKGPRNPLSRDQSVMAKTMSENAPLKSFAKASRKSEAVRCGSLWKAPQLHAPSTNALYP